MILVTGGLGYLGGRICQELVNSGYKVRIGTSRKDVNIPYKLNDCEIAHIDLLSPDSLKAACKGVSSIIHLAALSANACLLNPTKALEINGLGTLNILNAAIECKVKKFLYFSTIHVYGSSSSVVFNESAKTLPSHHYSISHKLAEDYVLMANKNQYISVSIFRLSNVVGAPLIQEVNCWTLVAQDLCRQVAENNLMELDSSKSIQRNFIGIQSLCNVVSKCFVDDNFKKIDGEIINICSDVSISLGELVEIISIQAEKILNSRPKIKYNESPIKKEKFIEFSNNKAKKLGLNIESDLTDDINLLLLKCKKWFS
jgi:UDP-glucose 4-epimerase